MKLLAVSPLEETAKSYSFIISLLKHDAETLKRFASGYNKEKYIQTFGGFQDQDAICIRACQLLICSNRPGEFMEMMNGQGWTKQLIDEAGPYIFYGNADKD